MANRRVGGIIFFKVDSALYQAKGEFSYNLGVNKRESVVGSDGIHGFKEEPQPAMIEGAITDSDELDLQAFLEIRDATATLQLANGKTVVVREAFYSGDGNVTHTEGEIEVKFEGISGEEIPA